MTIVLTFLGLAALRLMVLHFWNRFRAQPYLTRWLVIFTGAVILLTWMVTKST